MERHDVGERRCRCKTGASKVCRGKVYGNARVCTFCALVCFPAALWTDWYASEVARKLNAELSTRSGLARLRRTLKQSAKVIAELQEARRVPRELLDQPMTI